MKKIISFALVIMMIAIMSVTAFATTINKEGDSASITVKGNYVASSGGAEKISVTVEWENMEFTYTAGGKGDWDATNHKYGDDTEGSWSTNKGTIIVKNHSNVAVTATLAWAQNSEITGTITGTFSGEDVTSNVMNLVSADDDAYRSTDPAVAPAAPTATAQFGISGDAIDKSYDTEENSLGTITVTIAKKVSTSD